ncbi:MAG TPA: hypothetical protein EYG89_03830 [Bacteroidia bacterium]|nr:hypothetical protein [Bacteroidia bacterium]
MQNKLLILNQPKTGFKYLSIESYKKDLLDNKIMLSDDSLKKSLLAKLKSYVSERIPTSLNIKGLEKSDLLSIQKMCAQYQTEIVSDPDTKAYNPEISENIKLDVIGDIHGLYDETILLMNQLGYDNLGNHPENRKIVFLGDFVDRGPKSLETLDLVIELVQNGHYAILGNHEEKVLENNFRVKNNISPEGSIEVKKTFSKLKKSDKYFKYIYFMESLPTHYTQGDFLFCHADISEYSLSTGKREFIYGRHRHTEEDFSPSDTEYENNFITGINKFKLIRGHLKGENTFKYVTSLDEDGPINGNLVGIRLDEIINDNFEAAKYRVKSTHFYSKQGERKYRSYTSMEKKNLLKLEEISTYLILCTGKRNQILDFARNIILIFDENKTNFVIDPYSKSLIIMKNCKLYVGEDGYKRAVGDDKYEEVYTNFSSK